MKQLYLYVTLGVVLIATFAGCSGINSLLKSRDFDKIYAKGLEYYEAEKWSRASTLFQAAEHYYIGNPREDTILFYNARCKYKEHDYEYAIELFDNFRRKFGRSEFIEDAEGMYTMCFYETSPGPKRDQTMTVRAITAINEFTSRYPDSDKLDDFALIKADLTQRLHDKSYYNAYTYYKVGRYKSAIVALRNAIKEFPDSNHREELMYLVVDSGHRLAKNSIMSKQTDRYMSMLDSYYSFVIEFPESKYIKELDGLAKNAKDYLDKNSKETV